MNIWIAWAAGKKGAEELHCSELGGTCSELGGTWQQGMRGWVLWQLEIVKGPLCRNSGWRGRLERRVLRCTPWWHVEGVGLVACWFGGMLVWWHVGLVACGGC